MRETEKSPKPVRLFNDLEMTSFRAGRSAARNVAGPCLDVLAQDRFFERGFNQERLLVRSEAGEVFLVSGFAVVCPRCQIMRLYDAPGCRCWDTAEVAELAYWMRNRGIITERIADLLDQYRLEYGVLMHRPAMANFGFVTMERYRASIARVRLPVLQYPTGEPFFLGSQ